MLLEHRNQFHRKLNKHFLLSLYHLKLQSFSVVSLVSSIQHTVKACLNMKSIIYTILYLFSFPCQKGFLTMALERKLGPRFTPKFNTEKYKPRNLRFCCWEIFFTTIATSLLYALIICFLRPLRLADQGSEGY